LTIDLVFVLLVLGHVLGDFYFQTDKMVEEKESSTKVLIFHGIEYMICIGAVLLIGIPITQPLLYLWSSASLIHFIIDVGKKLLRKCRNQGSFVLWMKGHLFILDQFLHLVTLMLIWRIWGINLTVKWFIEQEANHHLISRPPFQSSLIP